MARCLKTPCARHPKKGTMKKLILTLTCLVAIGAANAQFQVNPQLGINYQQLTNPAPNVEYNAALGWQLGADFRIGDRLFVQPGAFFGRNATLQRTTLSDTLTVEGNLVRTNLKLKAMIGYRIVDTYQFDIRFAMGPTYDVLLSVDDKNDKIGYNAGDFNNGSLNIDAALGFDMGLFTLEPSVSFGLSRVFNDNLLVRDIDSRYLTYGLTLGVNFGNDDK